MNDNKRNFYIYTLWREKKSSYPKLGSGMFRNASEIEIDAREREGERAKERIPFRPPSTLSKTRARSPILAAQHTCSRRSTASPCVAAARRASSYRLCVDSRFFFFSYFGYGKYFCFENAVHFFFTFQKETQQKRERKTSTRMFFFLLFTNLPEDNKAKETKNASTTTPPRYQRSLCFFSSLHFFPPFFFRRQSYKNHNGIYRGEGEFFVLQISAQIKVVCLGLGMHRQADHRSSLSGAASTCLQLETPRRYRFHVGPRVEVAPSISSRFTFSIHRKHLWRRDTRMWTPIQPSKPRMNCETYSGVHCLDDGVSAVHDSKRETRSYFNIHKRSRESRGSEMLYSHSYDFSSSFSPRSG